MTRHLMRSNGEVTDEELSVRRIVVPSCASGEISAAHLEKRAASAAGARRTSRWLHREHPVQASAPL